MGLHQVVEEESDPWIMLQIEIIHWYRDVPFYMSLHLGNDILHNCMLDSGASANVMPISVMKQLGLDVHRPYGNVCRLDSRSMSIHDVIKDMVVRLIASQDISIIMDIVVVDLPPSYGMLLSRKFSSSLSGTIQMDLSFASIPNPEGRLVRIMREPKKPFHVEKATRQVNRSGRVSPIYYIDDEGQGEDDSNDFLGFCKTLYSLPVVEQPFSLPDLSANDESDYVDVVEEIGDSSENKGKALVFLASHASREQGS